MRDKYFELGCDITLNEERFDKDGNTFGGDGVVFSWENGNSWYYKNAITFNGNGHSIKGFVAIDSDDATGDFDKNLFNTQMKKAENVVFENVYVYGGGRKCANIICYSAKTISNIKMLSGFVVSRGDVSSSLAYYVDDITNCENHIEIHSYYQGASGLVSYLKNSIKDCVNYANIYVYPNEKSSNGRGCGLVQSMEKNSVIENCVNYGNIEMFGENAQGGGIVSWGRGKIKNCRNYGDIDGFYGLGGIVGYKPESDLEITSCQNYGKVKPSRNKYNAGGIIGSTCDNDVYNTIIRDCYSVLYGGAGLVGIHSNSAGISTTSFLTIKDCKVDVVSNDNSVLYLLIGAHHHSAKIINISNVEVNVLGTGNAKLPLYYNKDAKDKKLLSIKNIIINIADGNGIFSPLLFTDAGNRYINLDGIVVNQNGNKCYYGSDFSAFYSNWKTGKIGLKSLDGNGFYQTTLNESVLQAKGYGKKVFPA